MNLKSLLVTLMLTPTVAMAQSSVDVQTLFPFAAQSHDPKGEVDMEGSSFINGTNGRKLDFKRQDNLAGKCDGGSCTLSGNTVPGLALQWPNNWAFNEPWSGKLAPLPEFFDNTATASPLVCDWNNNLNATASSAVYQSVTVVNKCKIDAKQAKVRIQGKLSVSGSGTLLLVPGHYYIDELQLADGAGIEASPAGAIHLYVKHLDLNSSRALGTTNSPVNLVYYGQDAQINGQLVGSFNTHAHLQMSGSGDVNKLIQAKSLAMQGSAKVTMLPGSYWLEKLDLQGSAQIIQPQTGDINLHVKDNVSIKIAKLGASDRRINIRNYNANVDLGSHLTLYGDLFTHDELELHNSQLYGAVQAKRLDLQGSAQLHLSAGEYWFEDIELQGSSKINLAGVTTLHIRDELELEGAASINATNTKPLFIVVHGEKDDDGEGDVDLEGSSQIHGYLYVQGEVELQGSSQIYGAVNVVDLEMEGSSAIIYKAFSFADQLHHYRLSYNSQQGKLNATACADSNCYIYYKKIVDKLHIKDGINNNSIANFNGFTEQSSTVSYQPKKQDQCVQFAIHENSTNPNPLGTPGLRCWQDGVPLADCKLCTEPQEAQALAAYVFGEVTITEAHLKGLVAGASLTLEQSSAKGKVTANGQLLTKGATLSLPLTVSDDQAEAFTLDIKAIAGKTSQTFKLKLVFVPKSLAWITAINLDCGASNNSFVYAQQAETCTVLGKAGSELKLVLQAYGEADAQGKPRVINNYQAELGKIMQLQELDAAHKLYAGQANQAQWDLQFNSKNGAGHELIYFAQHVGLIKATVQDHYAALGDNAQNHTLKTQGESLVLGRTVPAHLQVTGITGEISHDVAYRAKEIDFNTPPAFAVVGCAATPAHPACAALPSYSGEFTNGLGINAHLTFSAADSELVIPAAPSSELVIDADNKPGTHVIKFTTPLQFAKTAPQPVQPIMQTLKLAIRVAQDAMVNGGGPTGNGEAKLDAQGAQLRYGFLSLDALELPLETKGEMQTRLNYYGNSLNNVAVDHSSDWDITSQLSLSPSNPDPSGVTFADKVIKVPGQSAPWKGTVTLPVAEWLRPYQAGGLVNPWANLHIFEQARKQGSDRIFNRREVVR